MTLRDKAIAMKQPIRRNALGKGINSLLGDMDDGDLSKDAPQAQEASQVKANNPSTDTKVMAPSGSLMLRVGDIEPNPHQPRKHFDEKLLRELSESLKVDGVIQPVVVSRGNEPGKYNLVAGERRWRASQLAGLQEIPAIIKEGTPGELLRIALIENIQRSDLNPLEEAEAYAALIKDFGLTQEQCADKVGKDRSTVTNALRLLSLPREIQRDLIENTLTMGHARALLALEDKKLMLRARDIVVKKALSVRQTEALVKDFKEESSTPTKKPGATGKNQGDIDYIAESLRNHLRTKVKILGSGQKGKIEISYFSAVELERLIDLIGRN